MPPYIWSMGVGRADLIFHLQGYACDPGLDNQNILFPWLEGLVKQLKTSQYELALRLLHNCWERRALFWVARMAASKPRATAAESLA